MPELDGSALDTLADHVGGPCVSILLPVDRRHPDDRHDHLQLKNLVASARSHLARLGTPHIDELLAGVEAVSSRPVLAERSGGLALFAAPGWFCEYRTDEQVEPLSVVSNHFAVASVVPALRPAPCYVLSVGSNRVQLDRVEGSTWTTCDVPDLPRSVDDALWYEKSERMTSAHAGGPGHGGALSVIAHGQGGQDEDRKERLGRFFRKLDGALTAFLRSDPEAIVAVAGTGPVVACYLGVSQHRHLMAVVVGSPEELSGREFRRRVAAVMDESFPTGEEDLLARLHASLGTGLATTDLTELVHTAAAGRVAELLVGSSEPRWGLLGTGVELLDDWAPDADDLLNMVVCDAWRQRASVHSVRPGHLPDGAPLAALYRY